MPPKVRFPGKDEGFFATLQKRVNGYFRERNLSKHANGLMIFKTISMFAIFFIPYFLILFGNLSPWGMLAMTFIMGIGMAGLGMGVMHDANHGSYSSSKTINQLLGFSMNAIGGNKFNWKINHNILHHTYTNVHEVDQDLDTGGVVRLSRFAPLRPYHRFQHIYGWLLYGFATLSWVVSKDFKQFNNIRKKGLKFNKSTSYQKEFWIMLSSKLLYYSYIAVIPFLLLDISWWQFLIGFFTMHYTAGIILGITFQLAHVVEQAVQVEQHEVKDAWAVHQMYTTANFCRKNPILNWFLGGLNFQIEHHLFPHVCHIHYTKIAPIVKKTAEAYGLPYNEYHTLKEAMGSHHKMLKTLGRGEWKGAKTEDVRAAYSPKPKTAAEMQEA